MIAFGDEVSMLVLSFDSIVSGDENNSDDDDNNNNNNNNNNVI